MQRIARSALQTSAVGGRALTAAVAQHGAFRCFWGQPSRPKVAKFVVTEPNKVPATIRKPDYATSGSPTMHPPYIWKCEGDAVVKMRRAARVARRALDYAASLVQPGITTDEIDKLVHAQIIEWGAYPSPLNYSGFPKSICTSVNEVVCHGIPDMRPLQEGDIISIDVSVFFDGVHGDNCTTVGVGKVDEFGQNLMRVTQECLDTAIKSIGPGVPLNTIGQVIYDHAEKNGYGSVEAFCGHGLGEHLHMRPLVKHFPNGDDMRLFPGMVFTIEPALVEKSTKLGLWDDDWTAVTLDGGRAAQFEHEVLITDDGVEILTVNEDWRL